MKPIVKYQGGKTRELPMIKSLLPKKFNRVVEPFCGGAAVSFALNKPSLLGDLNSEVINLYTTISDEQNYETVQSSVNELKNLSHDDLETKYYEARDIINSNTVNPVLRSISYITVRQLCFSGMERYNKHGLFNVPFGHYKKFSCNLSREHHVFLKESQIEYGDFDLVFEKVAPTDFVFVDPPYLDRLGYINGDGGLKLHERLFSKLKNSDARWMLIHSDCEFYRDTYKEYNIVDMNFGYAQRFGKNKNHNAANVKHLYITNYTNDWF